MAAQLALVPIVPARFVVGALALGNTIGVTVVAIPLVFVTHRVLGRAAVQGVGHVTITGLAAAVGGGLVGVAVSLALTGTGRLAEAGAGAVAAGCALLAFVGIAFCLDDGDLRPALARLRQTAGLGSSRSADGDHSDGDDHRRLVTRH
jgi:putative peptidoglycan lipid II flippase